ncbi:MAG: potassium transporter TrkA [Betaproteobacteria bacterium RBG_19FT_COMBO_58_11]|nr:MAG: potassium transporter TrkA [Betaproteobacteria bacterium RBG_19FT_COMBO_58_11]
MQNVLFVLLRRIRTPLILLIVVYAISVLGFVLIPGVDDKGQPWHMGFFHAFYVVSYTATTIGFGELPYLFTNAQRLWSVLVIYASVLTWLYSIGALFTALQDPGLRSLMVRYAFQRDVARIREPFYLICGYGDTGTLLARALAESDIRSVVLDINQECINALKLEDLPLHVPGWCADASHPDALTVAGLTHGNCIGVIALTHSDDVNLRIAITARLLHPHLITVCRAESLEAEKNMIAFGTDHIINPFDTFAARLAMALHAPGMYLLYEWMTATPTEGLREPIFPPHGHWILCGYGRFGKAVQERLTAEGIAVTIIEADHARTMPPPGSVQGRGAEPEVLRQAGIEAAAGIVAGTDNDATNLSIALTARALNPKLFMVARQNQQQNEATFRAANLQLVMQRAVVIAHKIFALITTPLLPDFLQLARAQGNDWANVLVARIGGIVGDEAPSTWVIEVNAAATPTLAVALQAGRTVRMGDLYLDPRNRADKLPCLALLLMRGNEPTLLPPDEHCLAAGDRLLLCGRIEASRHMNLTLYNHNALNYVLTGIDRPAGLLWDWLTRQRG